VKVRVFHDAILDSVGKFSNVLHLPRVKPGARNCLCAMKGSPDKTISKLFCCDAPFFFFSFSNPILLAVSSNSTSANRNLIISSTSLRSANDTHVNDFPSCRTPLCRPQKLLYRQSGERRNKQYAYFSRSLLDFSHRLESLYAASTVA